MAATRNVAASKAGPRSWKTGEAARGPESVRLRQEYEDMKRHNETLKSLVARYQKELKDQSRSAGGTSGSFHAAAIPRGFWCAGPVRMPLRPVRHL